MRKKPSPTIIKHWLYKTLGGGVLLYGLIVILITASQNYLLFPGITLNKKNCVLAASEQTDPNIISLQRAYEKLTPINKAKMLEINKLMFKSAFDEEGEDDSEGTL